MTDTAIETKSDRPPPWRDVRVLRIVGQVAFAILVYLVFDYLWGNVSENSARQGLPTGFEFRENPSGFQIRGSDFRPSQKVAEAFKVGVKNTFLVAAVGVILTTIIGVLVGIARLSSNWIVRKAAALYVETLRNIPVLIIIIFFNVAVIAKLPIIQEAVQSDGLYVISNRGIFVPWATATGTGATVFPFALLFGAILAYFTVTTLQPGLRANAVPNGLQWLSRFFDPAARWARDFGMRTRISWVLAIVAGVAVFAFSILLGWLNTDRSFAFTDDSTGVGAFWLVLLAAALLAGAVAWWRTKVNQDTGKAHHRVIYATVAFLAITVAGYVAVGAPLEVTGPTRNNRIVEGGIEINSAYAALLLGLVLYTASHVAEIVRGSILAVPKGQVEAADALALSSFQRMRHVVLPQALRIMIPPLANQYLNLTKNSSLAIAIGYAEVTTVSRIIIGNGNPAIPTIGALMLVYLVFSIVISMFTNFFNRRLQLVGR